MGRNMKDTYVVQGRSLRDFALTAATSGLAMSEFLAFKLGNDEYGIDILGCRKSARLSAPPAWPVHPNTSWGRSTCVV